MEQPSVHHGLPPDLMCHSVAAIATLWPRTLAPAAAAAVQEHACPGIVTVIRSCAAVCKNVENCLPGQALPHLTSPAQWLVPCRPLFERIVEGAGLQHGPDLIPGVPQSGSGPHCVLRSRVYANESALIAP
jgi:hypothetical protein